MASFASGLMSGYTGTAMKKRDQKKQQPKDDTAASMKRIPLPFPSKGAHGGDYTGVPSYKRGGKVRKTGLAKLHKGEVVVPKGQAKKMRGRRARGKGR
jgi:hypothetical protein